jgi:hypothetical protein
MVRRCLLHLLQVRGERLHRAPGAGGLHREARRQRAAVERQARGARAPQQLGALLAPGGAQPLHHQRGTRCAAPRARSVRRRRFQIFKRCC